MKIFQSVSLPFITMKESQFLEYARVNHHHSELSINLILSGNTIVIIEGKEYRFQRNDLVFIPPLSQHLCTPDDDSSFHFLNIYLDTDWMNRYYGFEPSRLQAQVVAITEEQKQSFLSLRNLIENEPGDLELQSETFSLIDQIVRWFNLDPLDSLQTDESAVSSAKEYIRSNYHEMVTLDQLADISGYNKYHFIRMFSKSTATTPHKYLINIRINEAQKMLASEPLIASIAYECGFTDESHFIRTFKQYTGMTPGEYGNQVQRSG